jgi:hypothetical protein
MHRGEEKGMDTSPLWEESRIVREMILSGKRKVGIDATSSIQWPDVLGQSRYSLPTENQRAITAGETAYMRLITLLEIPTPEPPKTIPPQRAPKSSPKSRAAMLIEYNNGELNHKWTSDAEFARKTGRDERLTSNQLRLARKEAQTRPKRAR